MSNSVSSPYHHQAKVSNTRFWKFLNSKQVSLAPGFSSNYSCILWICLNFLVQSRARPAIEDLRLLEVPYQPQVSQVSEMPKTSQSEKIGISTYFIKLA
jgi:hypothetical protein